LSQFSVKCAVYRGGTSRGLFFHEKDLPQDYQSKKKIFLTGIDAYNKSQINGLGSGTSHTSKVVVVSPPTVSGASVDYTFYQIGIGEEIIDDQGTCGNLMAAVGAFAVDEGLVQIDPLKEYTDVLVFNTNIQKMIKIKVPVAGGQAKVSGDYFMPGVNQSGARFFLEILCPGGGKTGQTLPLGVQSSIDTIDGHFDASFVDVVNPFVFVSSRSFGIKGTELNSDLSQNIQLLNKLEEIRCKMAIASGMAETVEMAKLKPAVPKVALVAEPQDYITSSGILIKKEEVDIVGKMISMGRFHRTFAASGLFNLASAALLPGTVPNLFFRKSNEDRKQIVRIGHPEGVTQVCVSLTEDNKDVAYVGIERTARRIIKGDLFVPQ
jgi:2-methylaconitate cis-trans-isomerase PrpF